LSAEQTLNNAQLALAQAQTKLAGTVITAPIDGKVLSVGGAIGSRVSVGGTGFIVLGQVATLAVSAQFTEADVGRLAIDQVASITLPDRLDPVSGKVLEIDPAGTISNRLVRYGVVIAFDQEPDNLLLGESVSALVTTDSRANVLYVASAAVTANGPDTGTVTVQTVKGNEVRTVGFGLRGDQYTEITSGLTEGEVVVLPANA
jgi:HlyD family secretion protein